MPGLPPKFDAPPVVETVLSIQFARLPNFTGAHAGWFWKSYLGKLQGEWSKVAEVPRLEDQSELFGDKQTWIRPGVRIAPAEPSQRMQFIRSDEERMVQVQDSRLVLNWKRGAGNYPSYQVLLPEFRSLLNLFSQFTRDAGYETLKFSQWEITYVNLLFKNELWSTPDDLRNVFNGIFVPQATSTAECESISANWRFVIGDNQGRLHINLSHVKVPPEDRESMRLQFVARGPVDPEDQNLDKYFDLGHDAIVRTFVEITSPSSHKFWKRTQ